MEREGEAIGDDAGSEVEGAEGGEVGGLHPKGVGIVEADVVEGTELGDGEVPGRHLGIGGTEVPVVVLDLREGGFAYLVAVRIDAEVHVPAEEG